MIQFLGVLSKWKMDSWNQEMNERNRREQDSIAKERESRYITPRNSLKLSHHHLTPSNCSLPTIH
jgi:hypothetical protein